MNVENDYWGSLAHDFENLQRNITGEGVYEQISKELESETDLGDLLEIGCGTCLFTTSVDKQSKSILATDCSEPMLEKARQKTSSMDKISVEKADCYDLPYGEDNFNSALMANVLHVVDEPDKVLDEIYRVLAPEGRLLLISFTSQGMTEKALKGLITRYLESFGEPPKRRIPLTLESASRLLESSGFKVSRKKLIATEESSAIYMVAQKIIE